MKNLLLAVVVLAMVFGAGSANAEGKLSLNIGGDVLIPMGTFGDAVSTGFGGTIRGQYDVDPMFSVTLTSGYLNWSGKDFTTSGVSFTGPAFKGIPIMVGGKYYFMPEGKLRAYGMAELGVFIASVEIPEIKVGNVVVVPKSTETQTKFAYAPILGVEFEAGKGTMIDVSARYFSIATEGDAANNIGFRAGVRFGL